MDRNKKGQTPASIKVKKLLTKFLIIPAFVSQMAIGCASDSEPSSPTYLVREIDAPKSSGKPEIKFTIATHESEFEKLKNDAKRTAAGSVRLRFDLDEKGTVSDVKTEIVGEPADVSEAGRLVDAANYLLRNNLKISATLDGRPVAAKGVETVVHFDRVSDSRTSETAATAEAGENAKTVGRVVLAAVGIIILIPIAILSGGHMSFGN